MADHPRGAAADPSRSYRLQDPDDMTLNELRHVRLATRVDVANDEDHGRVEIGAALIWWAAMKEGEPIRWETLGDLTATQLAGMIDESSETDVDDEGLPAAAEPAGYVEHDPDELDPTAADEGSTASTSAH